MFLQKQTGTVLVVLLADTLPHGFALVSIQGFDMLPIWAEKWALRPLPLAELIRLISLFLRACSEHHLPIANLDPYSYTDLVGTPFSTALNDICSAIPT